jgi:hypothetical protein
MRATRKNADLDAMRSSEREGECAGKSIIELVRAELIRVCIRYLRHKEYLRTGRGKAADKPEELRGEIIGLSKAVLCYELPYKRGDESERKRIVARSLKEARRIETFMAKRKQERGEANPREFRVADSGSLMADLTESEERAQAVIDDMLDMVNGRGAHADHTQQRAGRCVTCSCGKRAQVGRSR